MSQCCVKYVMATATAAACISPPLLLPLLPLLSLVEGTMAGEVRLSEALSLPSNRCLRAWRLGVPTNNKRSKRPGRVTATVEDMRGSRDERIVGWKVEGEMLGKTIVTSKDRGIECMEIR